MEEWETWDLSELCPVAWTLNSEGDMMGTAVGSLLLWGSVDEAM
jgi:hypothetical protein